MKMTEIDTNSQGTRESRPLDISLTGEWNYFSEIYKKQNKILCIQFYSLTFKALCPK